MPNRVYNQVERLLLRGNGSKKLAKADMTVYKSLIDFETNIDDFFDKHPEYKGKYGKDTLSAEKISEIYYDFTTGKTDLESKYNSDLQYNENQKKKYLEERDKLRSVKCGGDSKVYEEAKYVAQGKDKDKDNIKYIWDINKNSLQGKTEDPRSADFDEVFNSIELQMKTYTGQDFKADFLKQTNNVQYYDAVYPIIDFIQKQAEAQKIIDDYETDLGDDTKINRVRQNEKAFDTETQQEIKNNYDAMPKILRDNYEKKLAKAEEKHADVKSLCDGYAEKFGGVSEERREGILHAKQRENVKRVRQMRENFVNEYKNTSWISRVARWILPNSWSKAGQIQNKINELDQAMEDCGYSKDYADQLIAEGKHGETLLPEQQKPFKDILKKIEPLSSFLVIGASSIQSAVESLSQGKIYSENGRDLIKDIINTSKYILENSDNYLNKNGEDFRKETSKILEVVKLAGRAAQELSSEITGESIPDDDFNKEINDKEINDKDKDFKELDENFVKDVNGIENNELSDRIKESDDKVVDLNLNSER